MFAFNRFRAFGRLGPRGKIVGQVRGLRRFFVLTLSVVTAASTFLVFELSSPASASPNPQVTPILAGVAQPEVEAVDGSNNLYVYNDADGTITVLPSSSGTIFGQAVTANVAVQLEPSGGTLLPGVVNGMAFDSAGDLFLSRNNYEDLLVIPAATGHIFGQAVTADTPVVLNPGGALSLTFPDGLAFDTAGDLFVINNGTSITVIPAATGHIFGQAVTINTPVTLAPGGPLTLAGGTSLVFDFGNLFAVNSTNNDVTVVPSATGFLFGQAVTINTPAIFSPTGTLSLTSPQDIAESDGNLYITETHQSTLNVFVVPVADGTLYGQAVTAGTPTAFEPSGGDLQTADLRYGIAFDSTGDMFLTNWFGSTVTVVPAATGTVFGQSVTINTRVYLTALDVSLPNQMAVDANGDLFVANYDNSTVTVLPASSGTLFGQAVTTGVPVAFDPSGGPLNLLNPDGIAFDQAGNLFIANYGGIGITVVPFASGTIFGTHYSANTPHVLVGSDPHSPGYLAFDPSGDLFTVDRNQSNVEVLPAATGTLFGQAVTADTNAVLPNADQHAPVAVAVDPAGNLYVSDNTLHEIFVLPVTTGTVFGQSVTANSEAVLAVADHVQPWGLAFDRFGDLYDAEFDGGVSMLPVATGTLFGQPVTANTSSALAATTGYGDAQGIVVDTLGNLYVDNSTSALQVTIVGSPPAPGSPPSGGGGGGGGGGGATATTTTTLPTTTTTLPTTTTTVAPRFVVNGVSGNIVAGVRSTLSITGLGFYAQPKVTIGVAGLKFVVAKDTGTALTVYVTSARGFKFKAGTYTVTVRLANARQATKRHYF